MEPIHDLPRLGLGGVGDQKAIGMAAAGDGPTGVRISAATEGRPGRFETLSRAAIA